MKKLSATLFLLTFTWLQYSWQLNFFHCKISNTFSAQLCDCEKITAATEKISKQNLPAQKPAKQTLTDEYYTLVKALCNLTAVIEINSNHAAFLTPGYIFCYGNNLLKPPQA